MSALCHDDATRQLEIENFSCCGSHLDGSFTGSNQKNAVKVLERKPRWSGFDVPGSNG